MNPSLYQYLNLVAACDRSANRCQACGRFGHYACECPTDAKLDEIRGKFGMLEPTQMHSEFWPRLIVYACGFVSGGILAWWLR